MSEDDIRLVVNNTETEQPSRKRKRGKKSDAAQAPPPGSAEPPDTVEPPEPEPKLPCPLTPLGHRNGTYVYLTGEGEVRELRDRDLNQNGILSLFGGKVEWLIQEFRRFDREGKPMNDWSRAPATAWLMRACTSVGLWDPSTVVRGPGVWLVTEGKEPKALVHSGDRLWIMNRNGRLSTQRAGVRIDRAIYVAAPKLEAPSVDAGPSEMGQRLFRAIKLWRFAHPWGARLVLGYVAASMLGAAPSWRAHIMLTGGRGVAKTSLVKLIGAALGAQGNIVDDFTEAGVRQMLTGESRAVLLDEAEGDIAMVEPVIALIRRMSQDGGGGVRGTGAQSARRFSVTGTALLAAIKPPMLQPADRSRITEIELRKPTETGNAALAKKATAYCAQWSPALRTRAVTGWERFQANFEVYYDAILAIEAQIDGAMLRADSRQADQIATLLAGADMMLSDEATSGSTAADVVDELRGFITSVIESDEEESDARQCLLALFTSQIEHWHNGIKSTVGRLIADSLDRSGGRGDAPSALPILGLRLEYDAEANPVLVIANRHQGLNRIFADTSWSSGRWHRALAPLEGATLTGPKNFHGVKQRAIAVPARYLPIAHRDTDPSDRPPPAPPPDDIPGDPGPWEHQP